MTSQNQIITFIINDIAPYCFEVNNIMGVPDGFRYRLRFNEKWISVPKVTSCINYKALIAMRVLKTGALFPLRHVLVENIRKVGDIYYFELILEKIVELSSDEKEMGIQINKFSGLISKEMDWPNNPGEYLEKAVLLTADHTHFIKDEAYNGTAEEKVFNSWGVMVKLLSSLKTFEDFDFLRIIGIFDTNSKPANVIENKKSSKFWLSSNTTYRLEIFQRAILSDPMQSAVPTPRDINLVCIPGETTGIMTKQHVVGKYDLLQFTFRTEKDVFNKNGFMLLEVLQSNQKETFEYLRGQPIKIPISISASALWVAMQIIGIFIFVCGFALLFFTEPFLKLIGIDSNNLDSNLLQNFGILMMVLTSSNIGGFINFFTAMWGFASRFKFSAMK